MNKSAQTFWDNLRYRIVTNEEGTTIYYLDGEIHRENGPAMIRKDGTVAWVKHGGFHRENGPAVTNSNGTAEYWLNDRHLTEAQWRTELLIRQVIDL